MLSKKEIELMTFLLNHKNQYIPSNDIAKEIGVSDRTARKYLQLLGDTIRHYGASITSKQGQGYCLKVNHELEFQVFWQELLSSKKSYNDISYVEASEDRQHYILNKLIFEEERPSLLDLANELYISKTTLTNTLAEIRKLVAPFQLTVISDKKGLHIDGKEADMRRFIMDYFFADSFKESLFSMVATHFIGNINFAELTSIVLDECRDAKLHLSDFAIHNLVIHLALMIQRMRSGYPIDSLTLAEDIQQSREYAVALRMLKRVEGAYQITFPLDEANYIALHLKVKNSVKNLSIAGLPETELSQHLKDCLKTISQRTGIQIETDSYLLNGLIAHMIPLQTRLENHIQLTNPLTKDIKTQFPEVFEVTKDIFRNIPECQPYQITDDEWAYIALHIMASIERYSNRNKVKVLVVCATGVGSAMMLKNRLEKEFAGSIQILDVVSYYEITEEDLKDVDLIISSVSLSSVMFLTPVINVSVFLSNEDVEVVRQYLTEHFFLKKDKHTREAMAPEKAKKIIQQVFSEQRIIVFKETVNKADLLQRMVSLLDEGDTPGFVDQFLEQIQLRENYSSVVFGDVLAFPHPATPLSLTEQIVVGICHKPIAWNPENQNIHFVFLLSPSRAHNTCLKYISPSLVSFVGNPSLQKQLMQNPTYPELEKLFIPLLEDH